ncbi:hypothetical protein [Bowmanella denitrificans]|uniref:hypothetical protein n=1 Tax=Bowmanella denitrificans TaxID=366582 RepID=UPI000C9D0C1D|nr:hypothetical protein [Bowmanella denitrificans]
MQYAPSYPTLQRPQNGASAVLQVTDCLHSGCGVVTLQALPQLPDQVHLPWLEPRGFYAGRYSQQQVDSMQASLRVICGDDHVCAFTRVVLMASLEQSPAPAPEAEQVFFWKAPLPRLSKLQTLLETGGGHDHQAA